MALFQRFQRNDQLVRIIREQPTVSQDEEGLIKLIVGLGNVGKKYEDTRHNAGFVAVETIRQEYSLPAWQEKPKFKARVSEGFVAGIKVVLLKPTTMMNLSGEAVRSIKDFYKLSNRDITVIHDEIDLPFGTTKEKTGGGSAGHNGIKSVAKHIGEDFHRIRIGIKNDSLENIDAADFVLARFSPSEKQQLEQVLHTLSKNVL